MIQIKKKRMMNELDYEFMIILLKGLGTTEVQSY